MKNINNQFTKGLITGVTTTFILFLFIGATSYIQWSESDVSPVCLVKPGIAGFVPVNGTSIGNVWTISEVTPMCEVKPGIAGFVPVNGTSIGNVWNKSKVTPMCLVKPSWGGFAPIY
jgi:hypothetical protein